MAKKDIKLTSHEPIQIILEYNGVLNEARDWSPLTTNMRALEREDDADRLVSNGTCRFIRRS